MALKDIRVTFYYADEAVFDKVKKFRTRERIVRWADEFYKRYGFKISEFPVPFDEKLYKKKFALARTNGPMANYTLNTYNIQFIEKMLTAENEEFQKESEQMKNVHPATIEEYKILLADHNKKGEKLLERLTNLVTYKTTQKEAETTFRSLLFKKIAENKIPDKQKRIPVIFCEFVDLLKLFFEDSVIGETFGTEGEKPPHNIVWAYVITGKSDLYDGPFIIIDVNNITKCYEHVLAHELVHGAGHTTPDNMGTPGNIMIYSDIVCRNPSEVNLEASDKAKMETAFFVV